MPSIGLLIGAALFFGVIVFVLFQMKQNGKLNNLFSSTAGGVPNGE